VSLAAALRAQARVLDALASEAEIRERAQDVTGDPLLRDKDVAEDLGVGVSDVCRMRRAGHFGQPIYLGKRRPRIRRSALEKFKEIAQQKRIA
jgi:predicted DNA-binding transcriptional regulator AlpA